MENSIMGEKYIYMYIQIYTRMHRYTDTKKNSVEIRTTGLNVHKDVLVECQHCNKTLEQRTKETRANTPTLCTNMLLKGFLSKTNRNVTFKIKKKSVDLHVKYFLINHFIWKSQSRLSLLLTKHKECIKEV